MLLKPVEWEGFVQTMKRQTGIDLHGYKPNQIQRRTLSMAESKGMKTLEEFSSWVGEGKENATWVADRLAINVSELFRNPEQWKILEEQILPELLKVKARLKIWSAGCSYGAEAHTLAVLLTAKFPGHHTVIGTDIDQAALAQARDGRFAESDVKCVPKQYLDQYFIRDEKGWVAQDAIRKSLIFRQGNLLSDRFESGFDLILCRNVVIYFTEESKDVLYRKFFDAIRPAGYLFVGSTERISQSKEIGFENSLSYFYKKPGPEDCQWRNAS